VTLSTHVHLVPRLRRCGAIPLLPLYVFMEWTRKILPFIFTSLSRCLSGTSVLNRTMFWQKMVFEFPDLEQRQNVKSALKERDLKFSSALSLTSALDECEWSKSQPDRFIPRNGRPYPSYRRLGGTPQEFDPRTLQSVASRCTD
jgi:hypothetical protein